MHQGIHDVVPDEFDKESKAIDEYFNGKPAEMDGDKEASRVRAFLKGISSEISDPAKKMEIYTLTQKVEVMKTLGQGNAKMIFTPADVDLRVAAQGI